jgi:hypothetical protein
MHTFINADNSRVRTGYCNVIEAAREAEVLNEFGFAVSVYSSTTGVDGEGPREWCVQVKP